MGRLPQERAMKYLADAPDARFLDFSANDRAGYCLCPACKELDTKEATDHGYGKASYGAHAGTTIAFVNALADAVAEKYPDILVTTLAYLGTLEPPRQLRPRRNVRVVVTTSAHWGTICRHVTESARQADIMRGWNRVGAKLIVWHYPIVFGPGYHSPILNLHVISGDMRFFINNGAKGVMLQALDTYTRGVDRELLRCWLAAKQMWDPKLNTDELVRDFTYGFYGPAAEPIQRFQEFLRQTWDDNHMEPSLQYGSISEAIFEPRFIDKALGFLDEAERLAGDDADLRIRVRLAKVPVWYCQVRRGPVDGLPAYRVVLDELRGDVWFRAGCAVPVRFDSRKHYWLLLDADDREDTWVYVDGKLAFKQVAAERKVPVLSGVGNWPVMLAARGLLTPGTSHELVLRVRYRDRADGRRWRPVSLISTNLVPLTHGGKFPDAQPGVVREIPRAWPAAVEEQRRLRGKP